MHRAAARLRQSYERAASVAFKSALAVRVAPHKQLRGGIRILPSLPRSSAGKVLVEELRRIAASSSSTTSSADQPDEEEGDESETFL